MILRVEVALFISGCGLPLDEIADEIGVSATGMEQRDKPLPWSEHTDFWYYRVRSETLRSRIREEPFWITGEEDGSLVTYPVEVETVALLEEIRSHVGVNVAALGAWCERNGAKVTIEVVIIFEGYELPSLSLSSDFVSFASQLNAEFAFDLYPGYGDND